MSDLNIVYDFSIMPITFDGLVAMCGAAALMQAHPFESDFCSVFFIRDSYRNMSDRDRDYDESIKRWRSQNILIRGAGLIENVRQVSTLDHRDITFDKQLLHPAAWTSETPRPLPYSWDFIRLLDQKKLDFRLLRAGQQARNFMSSYLSGVKKNISLSIRSADYRRTRDTNLDDWLALYNQLENSGYHCVIIPDQQMALSGETSIFPRERVALSAGLDLELRLALYESCHGNITWTGGHSSILWLSNCSFINFGSLNSASFISDERYWANQQISTTDNIPFFRPDQIYDWREASLVDSQYLIESSIVYLESLNV
tara:strand:+ start:11396 stop:12337 length:942 start_codon:yes stop_codon:yes gene_type:complete